jgi:hypothetical protein
MTSSSTSKSTENLKFDQHDVMCGINKVLYGQNLRKIDVSDNGSGKNQSHPACLSISTPNLQVASIKSPQLSRKCFQLPEEKFHSNELLKKCQHFDKLYDKQNNSSGTAANSFPSHIADSISNANLQQNKIAKTKIHNKKNNDADNAKNVSGALEMHHCNRRSSSTTISSSLNKYDQKHSQMNESMMSGTSEMDMIKINESQIVPQAKPLTQPFECVEALCENKIHLIPLSASSSTQPQITLPSALIKNDNEILDDDGGDANELKCDENPLKELDAFSSASTSSSTSALALHVEKQHYHCKDLKPIKSLDMITEAPKANRNSCGMKKVPQVQEFSILQKQLQMHDEYKHQDEKLLHMREMERRNEQERHNSILMNNDCKLHEEQHQVKQQHHQQQYHNHERMQDEQTSSDGTCRDKYCKNSETYGLSITNKSISTSTWSSCCAIDNKNNFKINEISSTNNSKINVQNNLNLDLYFDKELSAWMSVREKQQLNHKMQWKETNAGERLLPVDKIVQQQQNGMIHCDCDAENEIPITNIQTTSDVDCNSCAKLCNENEVMSDGKKICNIDSESDLSDSSSSASSAMGNMKTLASSIKMKSSNTANSKFQFNPSVISPRNDLNSITVGANVSVPTCACDDINAIKKPISMTNNQSIKKKSMLFTDGMYIYGPYDFDLFANIFYRFDEEPTFANEYNITSHLQNHDINNNNKIERISNAQLLKNHDDEEHAERVDKNRIILSSTHDDGVVVNDGEEMMRNEMKKEQEEVVRDMDLLHSISISQLACVGGYVKSKNFFR